jgi:hypothetical protein
MAAVMIVAACQCSLTATLYHQLPPEQLIAVPQPITSTAACVTRHNLQTLPTLTLSLISTKNCGIYPLYTMQRVVSIYRRAL